MGLPVGAAYQIYIDTVISLISDMLPSGHHDGTLDSGLWTPDSGLRDCWDMHITGLQEDRKTPHADRYISGYIRIYCTSRGTYKRSFSYDDCHCCPCWCRDCRTAVCVCSCAHVHVCEAGYRKLGERKNYTDGRVWKGLPVVTDSGSITTPELIT